MEGENDFALGPPTPGSLDHPDDSGHELITRPHDFFFFCLCVSLLLSFLETRPSKGQINLGTFF